MNAIFETEKRLHLAYELAHRWQQTKGIILTGSVAYSPNTYVTEKSDLDILIIHNNIKKIIPDLDITD